MTFCMYAAFSKPSFLLARRLNDCKRSCVFLSQFSCFAYLRILDLIYDLADLPRWMTLSRTYGMSIWLSRRRVMSR